ncbi:MAG: hypothetical protein LQ352_003394 [Teloschistes flavicans]|nr:MAG: hypothetical protein LQ352_003394 [Teloschistes flavicans]
MVVLCGVDDEGHIYLMDWTYGGGLGKGDAIYNPASRAECTVWLERFEGVSYMFDLVIVSNWVDCAGAPLMEPEIGSLPSAAGAGKEYAQAANMARTGRANLMTNCDEKVKIKINA